MLFNDLRAQNRRGYVAFPAGRVVGQSYRQTKLVVQLDHGGQVRVLVGRRVLRVAVQNRHLGAAAVIQHAQRVGDLVQRAHARGEQHRRFLRGHGLEIRQVRDLAGGDF